MTDRACEQRGASRTYCGSPDELVPMMELSECVRSRSAAGISGRDGDGVREAGMGDGPRPFRSL